MKKKSPINDFEDYNKFWNSNRFTFLQKQNLATNQHVWLFYINVDNRVYEFGKKSNKKKIILLKA